MNTAALVKPNPYLPRIGRETSCKELNVMIYLSLAIHNGTMEIV
jgi:hypothetical protein